MFCSGLRLRLMLILSLRTLPPLFFCVWLLYMKLYCKKVQFLRGQFMKKKLSVPGGNFSNYFMKILVFSQFYCSKSATLEIPYDMKIDSFFYVISIFPSNNRDQKQFVRTFKYNLI